MKRLKVAYSYSELLLEKLKHRYPDDYFQIHYDGTTKVGSAESEDEEIHVKIEYYITKEDLEYMSDMEVNEEQWDEFAAYFSRAIERVNDFESMEQLINYDAMEDVKRDLPNEDLNRYNVEFFKFREISQDYSDITFKLEARLVTY